MMAESRKDRNSRCVHVGWLQAGWSPTRKCVGCLLLCDDLFVCRRCERVLCEDCMRRHQSPKSTTS